MLVKMHYQINMIIERVGKKMKVALVSPEYYDIAHFGVKRKEIPPFGVLYLASVIEQKGINVTLYRVSSEKFSFDFTDYDIVGFSISSSVTYSILKKVRYNSQYCDNALLIAGGIHTTIFPEEVINDLEVDIACIGEGENTISEIIDAYFSKNYNSIAGIVYKDEGNGKYVYTPRRELIKDLDTIPFPARHLLPIEEIVMSDRLSNTNLPIAHILCSRGCPYSCNFCANQEHGIRYRTGKNIRKELEYLIEQYGIKGFCITDDNFIVNRDRIEDICNEITPLKLKWSSLSRVNTVDEDLLKKLKQSGCIEIKYGIESGSPRILKLMNKQITIDQIKHAISITHNVGIRVKAFILHGFPGENIESTQETIQLLEELKEKIDRISLFRFVPLPGSPAYNNAQNYNLTLPQNFEDIFIYNNDRKWWGTKDEQIELEQAYQMLEDYVKENWEKF
ncbi:MAG: B12-binding domain-containing radical SAM protein [Acetatifactor sp.]|nr:B12-binding domain-containing radical SAM protein [Acetatifactor sp.]